MKEFKDSFYILAIFILGVLLAFTHCSKSSTEAELEKLKKEQVKPEVIQTKPELKDVKPATVTPDGTLVAPRIEYVDTGSTKTIIQYDTLTEPFDTIAFLTDYMSLKFYMDSLTAQDVDVIIHDTLQFNKIHARSIQLKNNRNEDFYKTRKFFVGGTMGGNANSFSLGPTISYTDKKGNLWSGSYLLNPDNQSVFLSYQKKISLKRK